MQPNRTIHSTNLQNQLQLLFSSNSLAEGTLSFILRFTAIRAQNKQVQG